MKYFEIIVKDGSLFECTAYIITENRSILNEFRKFPSNL